MTGLLPAAARRLNSRDDVRVRAAAAEISAHLLPYVVVARPARFVQQGGRRHDLAGRAVPTLEGILLDEGFLYRVQCAIPFQSLDGDDVVAVMHDGEREAREDAAAVDVDGAGAALAVIAALLGPEELESLPDCVQQRDAC